MKGQISIYDYMDEKKNINIINPHIDVKNVYVVRFSKPNQCQSETSKLDRKYKKQRI